MARRQSFRPSNPVFQNGPLATAFDSGSRPVDQYSPGTPGGGAVFATLPDRMTLNGTILKSATLLALTALAAMVTWTYIGTDAQNFSNPFVLIYGPMIVGLGIAIATTFRPQWSPITAPAYAVVEGLLVGSVSALYNAAYNGIVGQALLATVSVAAGMLFLYSNRILRVTPKLRKGVIAATMGIMGVYVLSFVLRMFGVDMPFLHDTGPLGIGISLVIVGVASFNLLLDFDLIENGVRNGAPKWAEWYGGFALLVTLIWLYLEMLRLLSKLQRD